MSAIFLVTGATGQQGGATARELLKAGVRVHALVRDTSKPAAKELEVLGVVLFQGDYDNVEAINKATVGVKGIFVRVSSFTHDLPNLTILPSSTRSRSLATQRPNENKFSDLLTPHALLGLWTRSS